MYVDDLETLQENDFGMRKAMLSVMTMGSKAFLLSDVDQERVDNNQVKIGKWKRVFTCKTFRDRRTRI